jgi:2-haloacid dehalogenase
MTAMPQFDPHNIRTIAFDVFGTVVDWFGTIVRVGGSIDGKTDWPSLAVDWLDGYRGRVEDVRLGKRPWDKLDVLLQEAFADLAFKYHLDQLDPGGIARLGNVWHALEPWPDSIPALRRLKKRFVISALSNGNVLLLADMARVGNLGWDCIMSAELVRAYKPADAPYKLAIDCLGTGPGQVLYVAAHKWDVQAGQAAGLRAGYVLRWQLGKDGEPPEEPDPNFDVVANDLEDLATKLGVQRA